MIAATLAVVLVAAVLTYGFYRLVRFHNGVGVIGWAAHGIPARTSRWVPPGMVYLVNLEAFKLPPDSPHFAGVAFDAAVDGYAYHYEIGHDRHGAAVIKNITGPYA